MWKEEQAGKKEALQAGTFPASSVPLALCSLSLSHLDNHLHRHPPSEHPPTKPHSPRGLQH